MIQNRNIARKYLSKFIPAAEFNSVQFFDGDATGAPVGVQDVNTVGIVHTEISTFGFTALAMNTDGDTVQHLMALDRSWDYDQPIYCRVHWTSESSDTADDVLFRMKYELIAADAAIVTTASVNDALDTIFVADNVVVANAWQVTAAGKINAGRIDPTTKVGILLTLEMQTKAVGLSEAIGLLGLEFGYVPMIATDTGAGVQAAAPW